MTQRKPAHESFESFVERQIREAREDGQFDRLEGRGKPIPGLGGNYDPLWWVKNLIEREKLAVLPPSLEIRARVDAELAVIDGLASESEVRRRLDRLNESIAQVNRTTTKGPATSVALIDVEAFVVRWRVRR